MPIDVTYGLWSDAWSGHLSEVKQIIEKYRPQRICDIGGGANPLLPVDYIIDRGLSYTLLDISDEELKKAPSTYRKVLADVCNCDLADQFDLALSKMLAEHIRDGEQFHKNVFQMLAPGGIAFHFLPTLYSPPFVLNKLFPEQFSSRLLGMVLPRNKYQHAKFPAYYSWCRGPTRKQIRRFEQIGYEVIEYKGFFGHQYYARVAPLHRWSVALARRLVHADKPNLTSFAYVVLRRPRIVGPKL
jgi:SAM-dependent methyltransferase